MKIQGRGNQKRQVKKFIGGKWQQVKWCDIKKGDQVRIYERGHGYNDGRSNTFVALSDASQGTYADGQPDGIWSFKYEHGFLDNRAIIDVHTNVRKG